MFGFSTPGQKLVKRFLRNQFGKLWKQQWDVLSPVWKSLMPAMRDNMIAATGDFYERARIYNNEHDSFADTGDDPKWYRGYSIPLAVLRERVEDQAFQRNNNIKEFKAIPLSPEVVRQLTALVFDLKFLGFLQERKGEKIGDSDYYLLDIMEEAYRVESEAPSFTRMVKVGSRGSDPDQKKLMKAWKHREKSTPARYEAGSFYVAKL